MFNIANYIIRSYNYQILSVNIFSIYNIFLLYPISIFKFFFFDNIYSYISTNTVLS